MINRYKNPDIDASTRAPEREPWRAGKRADYTPRARGTESTFRRPGLNDREAASTRVKWDFRGWRPRIASIPPRDMSNWEF